MRDLKPKHRVFLLEHFSGTHDTAGEAAIAAGYAPQRAVKTARDILARPDAKAFNAKLEAKVVKTVTIEKQELIDFYASILRANPNQAGPKSPISTVELTKDGEETHLLLPKMEAADKLTKLMSWNQEAKDSNAALGGILGRILETRDT